MERNRPAGPVAVIDWNLSGHHPTYLREYTLAFAERGIRVVVLSPETPAISPLPLEVAWEQIPTVAWIKSRRYLTTRIARWLFARRIAARLRAGESVIGARCNSVLFGCFHEAQGHIAAQVMSVLGRRSAGLYVQAGIFHRGGPITMDRRTRKVASVLRHPTLDTIFMLDETAVDAVEKFTKKPVVLIPDITDDRVADPEPILSRLGLTPKTRPVLGLLGHLRPSKGVADMLAFARANPSLDATFLLAGSCRWAEFTKEEEAFIKDVCNKDPRVIFYPERIPEETAYNALVTACDVLWAVYRDCPHSSNTLAKAACFERPVVVADGYLMADQTRRYSIGEVVPPKDPEALRALLIPMLSDPRKWSEHHRPRWAEFREERSNARFRSSLRDWAVQDLAHASNKAR